MLGRALNVSEYIVKFNVSRFVKMFLYHLSFFYLGPFIVPIFVMIDNKFLAQNMAFIWPTKLSVTFIV